MVKTKSISFLKYNKFEFGNQIVSQFVVFECKWASSQLSFFIFTNQMVPKIGSTPTHLAWSIKLFGQYDEHILDDETTGDYHIVRRKKTLVYFPRDSYHRIANSNGCMTLLFSGRWNKSWKEYIDGKVVHYGWGRE